MCLWDFMGFAGTVLLLRWGGTCGHEILPLPAPVRLCMCLVYALHTWQFIWAASFRTAATNQSVFVSLDHPPSHAACMRVRVCLLRCVFVVITCHEVAARDMSALAGRFVVSPVHLNCTQPLPHHGMMFRRTLRRFL